MATAYPDADSLLSHADFVRGLARSLLADAHAAEDVAQEALVTALERPPRSSANLRSWLWRVTRNLAMQSTRSAGRRRARELERAAEEHVPSTAEIVEREATRAALVEALLALPEPSRTALVLHYYEGLSARQIASRLGIPRETVRTRLKRGVTRMRRQLEDEDSTAGGNWMAALVPISGLSASGSGMSLGPVVLASLATKVALSTAALALGFFAWRALGPGNAPTPFDPGQVASPGANPLPFEPGRRGAALLSAEDDHAREEVSAPSPEAREIPKQDPASAAVTVGFLGRFVDPVRAELTPESAIVELIGADGAIHSARVDGASAVSVDGLALGTYLVRVHAPGFRHWDQRVDMTSLEQAGQQRGSLAGSDPTFDERLVLWPEGWVSVAVETRDERPIHTLTDALGWEPRQLFAGTFEVRTRLDPPGKDAWESAADSTLVEFSPPPGYQNTELPGNSVGSLRLLEDPPMWVGLAIFGTLLEWKLLQPGDERIVFEIDQLDLDARLSSVRLRALDPSGSGLSDARITFKGDTSAHRRGDQSKQAPGPDGTLLLERVVPGQYELTIETGEALHQDRIQVAPNEDLDLGDIVLDASIGVDLFVRNTDGEPVRAWVEIAPYQPGRSVRDVYPPNLHRLTGRDGRFRLPMPSTKSIVRARLAGEPGMKATDNRSPNVLLDPDLPPIGAIELVVVEPVPVKIEYSPLDGASVVVHDALDMIVAGPEWRSSGNDTQSGLAYCKQDIVPGRYRAVLFDAGGTKLSETAFTMTNEPVTILLP